MRSFWTVNVALTSVLLMAALAAPLAGQSPTPESLTARIERSIRDSNLASPITGDRVSAEAVRLAQQAVDAFNELVNAATTEFLVDPPAEFLALHAILLHVSNVAIVRAT